MARNKATSGQVQVLITDATGTNEFLSTMVDIVIEPRFTFTDSMDGKIKVLLTSIASHAALRGVTRVDGSNINMASYTENLSDEVTLTITMLSNFTASSGETYEGGTKFIFQQCSFVDPMTYSYAVNSSSTCSVGVTSPTRVIPIPSTLS